MKSRLLTSFAVRGLKVGLSLQWGIAPMSNEAGGVLFSQSAIGGRGKGSNECHARLSYITGSKEEAEFLGLKLLDTRRWWLHLPGHPKDGFQFLIYGLKREGIIS